MFSVINFSLIQNSPLFQTMRVTDWSGFVDFVDRVRPARIDLRRLPYVKVHILSDKSLLSVWHFGHIKRKGNVLRNSFDSFILFSHKDPRRDVGGDRDGGGAEDEERHPPRVPAYLMRCHEQGEWRKHVTKRYTFRHFS